MMSGVCTSVQMHLITRFKSYVRCAFSVSYTSIKLSLHNAEKPFCPWVWPAEDPLRDSALSGLCLRQAVYSTLKF